ncbi:MAG: hypothetical protein ACYS8W_01760 [Planctomycetota bacterium]|jgi:hypothetical protein
MKKPSERTSKSSLAGFILLLALTTIAAGCPGGEKYQRKPAPPPPHPKTGSGTVAAGRVFTPNEEEVISREMRDITTRMATIVLMRDKELPESSAAIKRDLMKFAERDALIESASLETLLYMKSILDREVREQRWDVEDNIHNPAGVKFILEHEARERYLKTLNSLIDLKSETNSRKNL